MGKFNPDVIAQWIEQDCGQPHFQAVRDLLASTLRGRISKYSDEEIAEFAEQLTPSVQPGA